MGFPIKNQQWQVHGRPECYGFLSSTICTSSMGVFMGGHDDIELI